MSFGFNSVWDNYFKATISNVAFFLHVQRQIKRYKESIYLRKHSTPSKRLAVNDQGTPQSHPRLPQSLTTLAMAAFAFSSSLDAISINCSVLSTRERACSAKFPVSPMVLRIFCKRLIWLNKVLFTLWRRSIRFWSTSAIAVQKKVHKLSEGGGTHHLI